jgi:DNA integrity scanning protein DisA with diadenylate cyclase activity
MYPIFGSVQAEPKGMMSAFTSVDALPVFMLAFSGLFAAIMMLRSKHRAAKFYATMPITYFLQGVTLISALIILVSIFIPKLFDSVVNQRATIFIIAMMTLIYAARDIAEEIGGNTRGDRPSSHQDSR